MAACLQHSLRRPWIASACNAIPTRSSTIAQAECCARTPQEARSPCLTSSSSSKNKLVGSRAAARHSLTCEQWLQPRTSDLPRRNRVGLHISCSVQVAAAAVPGISLQRPSLFDTAPVKHRLPGSSGTSPNDQAPRGWPLLTPSTYHPPLEDPRRSLVKAAPRSTVAELSTAAQMARLSSLVYHADPRDRLEALGLEIRDCQQTPYTAFFVADGPPDLFAPQGDKRSRGGRRKGEGKTRYIISRGVAMDREEVKVGDLWMKLLRFWPVEFEKGLTPRGKELLVHEGVKEIAEQVYKSLLPHLAFDPKKEGITAVRFGGHSLGGSLSLLLMLMFHLRSPVTKGWASDIDFNSHTFGSFPVVANMQPFRLPWEGAQEVPPSSAVGAQWGDHVAQCPLMRTIDSLRSQIRGAEVSNPDSTSCSVLSDLGLPAGAAQGFVMESDIVPRAFMALKHDAVKSLLQLRERLTGSSWSGRGLGHPLNFQPVGTVHYMESQGDGVSVARMQPSLADKALHMEIEELLRNPPLLMKSLQDHYFNHYVTRLESAVASAQMRDSSL